MEESSSKLTLLDRQKLTLTGVEEVVSFDEREIILHTVLGVLTVQGQQLHLRTLSLEGGQVEVDGTVSAMLYQESERGGSWLSRLMQ